MEWAWGTSQRYMGGQRWGARLACPVSSKRPVTEGKLLVCVSPSPGEEPHFQTQLPPEGSGVCEGRAVLLLFSAVCNRILLDIPLKILKDIKNNQRCYSMV